MGYMHSRPLVSIITPTYNHEQFIGPCIESVLRQTYGEWEQIIVDDGSTDGTEAVARGYDDARIRYIRQENRGIERLADIYNAALSRCSGELIAILEGDDLWPEDKLETLVPGFVRPEVILAFGSVCEVDSKGALARRLPRQARVRLRLPKNILFNTPVGSSMAWYLRADGHELIPPSSVIIRRTALERIGGFQYVPGLCVTDFPTFARLIREGEFFFSPKVMGYRRRIPTSAVFQYVDQISRVGTRYALDLAEEPENHLTPAERDIVAKSWRATSKLREFTHGRLCLLDEQWARARSHFAAALEPRNLRLCSGAAAGWILSWFHCDLEVLFRLAGRSQLTRRA
jgi:glycosyltransferase involved in cell wall biosynthesis